MDSLRRKSPKNVLSKLDNIKALSKSITANEIANVSVYDDYRKAKHEDINVQTVITHTFQGDTSVVVLLIVLCFGVEFLYHMCVFMF